jgi:hypothetical protein
MHAARTDEEIYFRGGYASTWMNRELGVPLAQLQPVDVDSKTEQAVEDWHYWLER